MMKKNGFTLAEVLITLAIIGVVATLTLPALMTNTQEQQWIIKHPVQHQMLQNWLIMAQVTM